MRDYQWLKDAAIGIDLLRRIESGDEAAFKEINPLLARIDKRATDGVAAESAAAQRRAKRLKSDRKLSGKFQIAPACENGVDHSASGIVLLQHSDGHRLVWRSGGYYTSGQSRNYAPADLEIFRPKRKMQPCMPKHLTNNLNNSRSEESRLSKRLVLKYRDEIDAIFGEGAAERAAGLTGTIVVGELKL